VHQFLLRRGQPWFTIAAQPLAAGQFGPEHT
jgi:hypothetical protein